jgi:hypothetical protein
MGNAVHAHVLFRARMLHACNHKWSLFRKTGWEAPLSGSSLGLISNIGPIHWVEMLQSKYFNKHGATTVKIVRWRSAKLQPYIAQSAHLSFALQSQREWRESIKGYVLRHRSLLFFEGHKN